MTRGHAGHMDGLREWREEGDPNGWLLAYLRIIGTVHRVLTMERDLDSVILNAKRGLTSVPVPTSGWWSAMVMGWLWLVPAKDDDVIHGFSSCALNTSPHKLHQAWHILAGTRSFSVWLLLMMMRSHTLSCIHPSKLSGLVYPPWFDCASRLPPRVLSFLNHTRPHP